MPFNHLPFFMLPSSIILAKKKRKTLPPSSEREYSLIPSVEEKRFHLLNFNFLLTWFSIYWLNTFFTKEYNLLFATINLEYDVSFDSMEIGMERKLILRSTKEKRKKNRFRSKVSELSCCTMERASGKGHRKGGRRVRFYDRSTDKYRSFICR